MFRKSVYSYNWEKFNKTSLLEEEDFYSHLNMEDITDTDYAHVKINSKDFFKKIMICVFKVIDYC